VGVREVGTEGPAVVFSHGLFLTHRLFDAPVAALAETYRCVAYDRRGQGRSASGGIRYAIDVERVYEDAVALIESLDAAPAIGLGNPSAPLSGCASPQGDLISCGRLSCSHHACAPTRNGSRCKWRSSVR
jgi:alpha-beta hydrolase superfamily lysophospholipase